MVAAITNLRNFTASLKSPDDLKSAIENTNDRFCNNNDGGQAANSTGKLYSVERLQKFLNELKETSSVKEILSAVHESLQKSSGEVEQSDDITMLAVKFRRK